MIVLLWLMGRVYRRRIMRELRQRNVPVSRVVIFVPRQSLHCDVYLPGGPICDEYFEAEGAAVRGLPGWAWPFTNVHREVL